MKRGAKGAEVWGWGAAYGKPEGKPEGKPAAQPAAGAKS